MPRGVPNTPRERLPRSETVRQERRRRADGNLTKMAALKLALPPEFRDDKEHTYRWANDHGSRIYDLTKDVQIDGEWDACSLSHEDGESTVRKQVGTKENGDALYAVLLRKPMWIHEEDQAAKEARRKAHEGQMTKVAPVDPETNQPDASLYVRKGSSIKSGAFTP